MDTNFYSRRIQVSGTALSVCLGIGLSIAAFALDWEAERLTSLASSLVLPLLLCAAACASLGYWAIPLLQALKTGQVIRADGPQAHLKKAGTPTMGGIFFVPTAVAIAILWSGFSPTVAPADMTLLLAVSLLTLSYGAIGWIDDWQVIRRKSNKGISAKMKLALQVGFGAIFCYWLSLQPNFEGLTSITIPLGVSIPLGILFLPLAGFVLVAESNATTLTDGVDGLMGGTGAIAFLGLGAVVAPSSPALATFCACMSGGCLGFLVHNRNPAQVFMGDTGSLPLGAALAAVGITTNHLFALFVLSGLFFVETLSVILQVGYYKATKNADGVGKRLFRMAPLHHHLELSGWTERQVVGMFYLVVAVLACTSIAWF
ncbi:phospho-N-acetylmuramoyl-pentapeptide-transferase [Oscillatoriales cyanobacterium LEGE 11467]|uniref:Phospho-N-acetylmuramoyl-pentapeptide-transferase n=1 Tax=Zarconia navalis LEGE 11467 TaxID=1828826 RepID=A0A928Z6S2_9CYAN|nr:phospho-N-acetylmuramoyl-pentapeptide-transferase [Zarconia navalis]MBE9039820.1 phospho-N-acetylmuramoyl-pentapeptide-transferase [Zarconia navalis LEGE 11467]